MPSGGRGRSTLILLRNLAFAFFLYGCIYLTIELAQSPSTRAKALASLPYRLANSVKEGNHIESLKDGNVKVQLAGLSGTVTINPHANAFNRPSSTVVFDDAYLGDRPHVDTEADLKMLVEECRGSYHGLEKMRDVSACLDFLAQKDDRYYYLPDLPDRASEQDPRKAEYANADSHHNSLAHYPAQKPPTDDSPGQCSGPIIPYHVYWSGPATWRVEVFIKAYLHTQNLPCSRLFLWLDADRDELAAHKFLKTDPLFARFLPLVKRGDIVVNSWKFPRRMPLPGGHDHTDGIGYYSSPGAYNANGERAVADGIIEDMSGQQYIQLKETQMTFFAQAISDAVRFVILHLYGGAYFDMDVLMLRDMRPLLLPQEHNFAERWAAHAHPGDFNTAIMSLSPNSSLSSYLLRGGVRMGLNFHPRVIGRMAWKDGRDQELLMLETAAFDPVWTEFNWDREGKCTTPCLKDYTQAFKNTGPKYEWESFQGPPLHLAKETISFQDPANLEKTSSFLTSLSPWPSPSNPDPLSTSSENPDSNPKRTTSTSIPPAVAADNSLPSAHAALLTQAGVIKPYNASLDKYPPSNRTLANFFSGAWTYHVHNQWTKHPEPGSWLDVICQAHDRFLAGASGVNPYGETWSGPKVEGYGVWDEFL